LGTLGQFLEVFDQLVQVGPLVLPGRALAATIPNLMGIVANLDRDVERPLPRFVRVQVVIHVGKLLLKKAHDFVRFLLEHLSGLAEFDDDGLEAGSGGPRGGSRSVRLGCRGLLGGGLLLSLLGGRGGLLLGLYRILVPLPPPGARSHLLV